jgi:plasmid stabilization system protein ParE
LKIYQVRFAEEALADLARIFADLLPVAGEPLARGFVGRLEGACLKLATIYDVEQR